MSEAKVEFVSRFQDLPHGSLSQAGGKGLSLSRLLCAGFPVPHGFVICENSFQAFLERNDGIQVLRGACSGIDLSDNAAIEDASSEIQAFIVSHPLPSEIEDSIGDAYQGLQASLVAVRSSAIAEDGDSASFAGQQESYLNVRNLDEVLHRVRECWASFFSPRALFYRANKGVLTDTRIAVVVQEMVQSERSGVMFTVDPVTGSRDRMVIEAVFGLGEGIVSGMITPDQYVLRRGDGSLLSQYQSEQTEAVVHNPEGGGTQIVPLEGTGRVLTEPDLRRLWDVGLRLEGFFGSPQDVEWAFRGETLYLLQSRPVTALGKAA